MEFELKDYEALRLNSDGTRKYWSRKDGLLMASLMVAEARTQLSNFHDILLAIDNMSPQGINYCISHYHVATEILRRLYLPLLVNERVENGVDIERKEITPEERGKMKKEIHELVDKWF